MIDIAQTSPHAVPIYRTLKRAADVAVSLLVLILAAPLMALIVVAIRLETPGGAIFKQERVGKDGRLFTILKFRTMREDAPNVSTARLAQLKTSPITPLGRVLRRTSLDELPQLVNILRGEMSLVGPRPALPSQSVVNELRAAAGVLELLPGLTGWAQVNGRDELGDAEKVAFDAEYLRRASVGFDLWILVRTFASVFSGRGTR